LLVCISVSEQLGKIDFACEILSNLGPTLLVAEVEGQRIKGVTLLARVCDYTAAAGVLSQKLESCLDDWDRIINDLCQLPENKLLGAIHENALPIFHVCKLLQSSDYETDSLIPVILRNAVPHLGNNFELEDELENAVHEYFNRLGSSVEVSFQVLPRVDELRLIENLARRAWDLPALQEAFNGSNTISGYIRRGIIVPGLKSGFHGTCIALKTKNFMIVAADGKLTSKTSYDALKLKAEKIRVFGNLCVAVIGDWISSAKTISSLSTCWRFLKDENKKRPSISKFAEFTRGKLFSRTRNTEIIFAGFDQLKVGKPAVPCISYARGFQNVDVEEPFFCGGTGYHYAAMVLSKGGVHPDMTLDAAIALVEKALVYASMGDGCTGGWSSIYVIENDTPIRRMPREDICSTLWNRHREWLECMNAS
ncbi:hypothetical protein MKW92_029169, partial [Papaver armeniacum]